MTKKLKAATALLYAGTALVPLAFAAPAAMAQAPNAQVDDAIEEIIVTARRREESLKDVPVAVTAISGATLEQQGAVDITTLSRNVPNLTMQVARGTNSTLIAFIRGVGQQDPLWGFEPGVGLYFDDVYVARPQGAVLDIFDVERIEVLRGPQGTLYGRNTIGGAVKYVTRRLDDEANMRIKGSLGSYGQQDVVASGSVPVTDKIRLGGAVAKYSNDGFGENVTTGAEHYNKAVRAGRLSLEAEPTEKLFIRLSGDITRDTSNPRHGYRTTVGPAPLSQPVLGSVYDTRAGVGDNNRVKTRGLSLTAEYAATDAVTLKSITAYRDGRTDTVIDFDGLPAPTLDVPAFYEDDQFSQEFQATYSGDRWQGVAGIYYMDATAEGAFDTVLGGFGLTTYTAGSVGTESWAAFSDVSFDVTDAFTVSVGARYTEDQKDGTVYRANFLGIRSPALGGAPRNPFQVRTNYSNSDTFSQFTPRVSLGYELTDDINAYASYSKGFKSGGFDMRGDAIAIPATTQGYKPETVDSYELGLKGDFLDRRLSLNVAGFFADYKDQQFTIQTPTNTGTIASDVGNAGASTMKGLEFEGALRITDGLRASFALGYIDAEFDKFETYVLNPAFIATQPVSPTNRQFIIADVADSRVFQNTPEWTGNVTLAYTHDMGVNGSITTTGAASFRSEYALFEIPIAALDEDGYTLLDLSLVWTNNADTVSVGLHGKNLGNARYRVGGYNFPTIGNSVSTFYGPPRTYTATVEFKF